MLQKSRLREAAAFDTRQKSKINGLCSFHLMKENIPDCHGENFPLSQK